MFVQFRAASCAIRRHNDLICPACGTSVTEVSQFCPHCGKSLSPVAAAAAPLSYQGGPAQTSGKAIASLVCGIINVFPLFIVAIVLGHISLSEIKRSAGRLKGEGIAIAGLVLGYLGIAAIPIILIIAAIAIPNLLRAKIAANEASAVASMRVIAVAEASYQVAHEETGFTCNFSDLSGLLDPRLRSGFKNGYAFFLQNCAADEQGGPIARFQITAVPMTPNTSGVRAFCSDETGVIKLDSRGSAQNCLDHGSPLE